MLVQEADVWQAVLGELEVSLSKGVYLTWFKNSQLIKVDDGVAVIGVVNIFGKQQLETKHATAIIDTLAKNGMKVAKVQCKVLSGLAAKKPVAEETFMPHPQTESQQTTPTGVATSNADPRKRSNSLSHSYRQNVLERYTFENFVVGSGNELAYAACQGIAKEPGTKYNPLFLYGGVGIGKTHLMHATANAILSQNPNARIVYASTEQFVQEYVDALRYKKNTDFANYYRNVDVLIMDDVQFIAGKERVQEEFFHTFNALHQGNKQIIISSDRPPKEIPTLEDRLRSRFNWGMSIDMQTPDFETRCAIIQTKASAHNVVLDADLVEFLSNRSPNNVRELEGDLNRLLAFCEMRELHPNLDIATGLLGARKRPKHVSAKQVVEKTAKHFRVSVDEILGPKRDKDIVVPRQIAMYMLRSELHLSFPKIARELGRKDHTTAIHSVEKIEKELSLDADLREAVSEIKERLYA